MLSTFIGKYRQIIVLAIASAAIAAYVIPFNSGGVPQETQAQSSLYERLRDLIGNIRTDIGGSLDGLEDQVGGLPGAGEKLNEARQQVDQRLSNAEDRIRRALGGDNLATDTQSLSTPESSSDDDGSSNGAAGNTNNNNNDNNNNENSNSVDNNAGVGEDANNDEIGGNNDNRRNDIQDRGDQMRNRANELRDSARQ